MSIVPASRLSASDLARLGNNCGTEHSASPRSRRKREFVVAVNRSLAVVGEQVSQLHRLHDHQPHAATVISVA